MARNKVEADFNLDTRGADQKLDRMKGKFGALGNLKGPLMAAGAVAGVGVAAGVATIKISQAVASMQLSMNKIGVVFGDQLSVIQKWSGEVAGGMGVSSLEVQKLAANFQDLLIPMGFTRENATKMTMDVVGLSGALAEWSGGTRTAAEVSSILAKAMLGEREQLKTLGISIMENDVKQRVATMGMSAATGAAMQQARAMATQELIFEKSKDAQAAFATGSDSLARSQARLQSAIADVKVKALDALLPAVEALNKVLVESLLPTLENSILPWFKDDFPKAVEGAISSIQSFMAWNSQMARANEQQISEMGIDPGGFQASALRISNLMAQKNPIRWLQSKFRGVDLGSRMGGVVSETAGMNQRELLAIREQEMMERSNAIIQQLTDTFSVMSAKVEEAAVPAIEQIAQAATRLPTLAEQQAAALAEIGILFKEKLEEVKQQTIADQKAFNDMLLAGQRGYQDQVMNAMASGETERLNFLKQNNKKIEENVVHMIDQMKAAGFTNADIARVDIYRQVIDHMWKTHQLGIDAAKKAEDELAAKRRAELAAMGRNNIMLVEAMHASWVAGGMEGVFNPNQQFDIGGNLVSIPKAHGGGIVGGPRGRETPIMALGGETVLPLGGGRGVTININGLVAGDPVAIGQEIAEILNKSSRSNGAIINSSAVT